MSPVRQAASLVVERIDAYLAGHVLDTLPRRELWEVADELLKRSASVRTAGLFLAFYSVVEPRYDFRSVPTGWRGTQGDRFLGEELRRRSLALGNVKAFAENIGAKGAQDDFDPSVDRRFAPFTQAMAAASPAERRATAEYLASRYAESQQRFASLPAVGDDVLTFVRAKALFGGLVSAPSRGVFPQFLMTALIRQARAGTGIDVVTHNPFGSDRSDRAAGDIEERVGGTILRAYEVTANAPWRDRLSSAQRKMDHHSLHKYVILASSVNSDPAWSEPAALALSLMQYGRDIAVVDLSDVTTWMAAQLRPSELRNALHDVERMLHDPVLCGRHDLAEQYTALVGKWLDAA